MTNKPKLAQGAHQFQRSHRPQLRLNSLLGVLTAMCVVLSITSALGVPPAHLALSLLVSISVTMLPIAVIECWRKLTGEWLE